MKKSEQSIEITRWSNDYKPMRITLIIDQIPDTLTPKMISTIIRRAEHGVENIEDGIDGLPLFDEP